MFRLEYDETSLGNPAQLRHPLTSHWHVQAHRQAVGVVQYAALGNKANADDLSRLHLPAGGPRMRPGLEDFLQFIITELGVSSEPDAWEAIQCHREQWRIRQLKTAVRDNPRVAAEVLGVDQSSVVLDRGPSEKFLRY